MDKLILYLFLLLSCAVKASEGYDNYTYHFVDSLTYKFYTEEKWDSIIHVGDLAIIKGVDFLNLRIRLADAAIALGEPIIAQSHIKKAKEFDNGNRYVHYQLVTTELMMYRRSVAMWHISKKDYLKRDFNYLRRNQIVDYLDMESMYRIFNIQDYKPMTGFSVGLNSNFGWKWSFRQVYQQYSQSFKYEINPDSMIPFIDDDFLQKQYYGKLTFQLTENVTLFGGGHYVNTNLKSSYSDFSMPDTSLNLENTLYFGGLNYSTPFSIFGVSYAKSNFFDLSQQLIKADIVLKSDWKSKLLFWSTATYFIDDTISNNLVFELGMKAALNNFLYFDLFMTPSKSVLFISNNYESLFNRVDESNFKFGIGLTYVKIKHFALKMFYIKEELTRVFNKQQYKQQSINLKLIWYR